ncbi:MAG: IS91 family transposase [Candidatus Binatia bacterium]
MALPSPLVVAAAGEHGGTTRPRFEVADVLRAYGEPYRRTHPTTGEQRQVLRALARCRTAALGGHVEQCERCAYRRIAYNSCRNRHCPKCQGKERAQWMAAEQALLLPVPYFHVVFTLPRALNPLIRVNRRRLYGLLFRLAARTLRTFARDPHHLGAELAITMVLHTWGQTLKEHTHVHCVVSGGGLALDGSAWVSLPTGTKKRRRPFLFPVTALSRVFRGKFLAALTRARRRDTLRYLGQSAALAEPGPWETLIATLWKHDWVVYAKPPFGGPAQVLKYLSRYTHRVAIANQRLLSVANGVVRFEYHDSADPTAHKELSLPATEFLRRFLLHVVPKGFMRIRHYGITANRRRQQKLARCRELLGTATAAPDAGTAPPADADTAAATPEDITPRCPQCGAPLRIVELLPPQPRDTS